MIEITVNWNGLDVEFATLPERMAGVIDAAAERWGERLQALAEILSPDDKIRHIDPRRRPESERLVRQWRFSVDGGGGSNDVSLWSDDPKAGYILFPTKAGKTIESKGAYPLRFFTQDGMMHRRGFVVKGATPGQPVHLWAFDELDFDSEIEKLAVELI